MLDLIKEAIKKLGTHKNFAEEAGVREATLSEFLNKKTDIKFSTFEKIIHTAGLEVACKEPNKLMQTDYTIIDGVSYHVGDFVSDEVRVLFCFGSTHTTKQGAVLENTKTGDHYLYIS